MKTILIVAPHFPPSALPPAQRVRLMVKHLPELGYRTIILTVKHVFREEPADPWMCELAGNDFNLVEIPALPQGGTRKFGIGDLGLRFIPFLLPKLLGIARIAKPDFILYPVPPWYVLLIAPIAKVLTGISYGIDFIDPWYCGDDKPTNATRQSLKQVLSRSVARFCERWVATRASIIWSVSEGINNDLRRRYPELESIPMRAIPYGVEPSDFSSTPLPKDPNAPFTVRYIGAVWEDAYPVLEALFAAIAPVAREKDLRIEFFGTSYAGAGLAKPQLQRWRDKYLLGDYLIEQPERVPYKRAVELTMTADMLLLFGGVQPYYAASKLMGLVASGQPFLAFLHRDSFPARFLRDLGYPCLVCYGDEIVSADPVQYITMLTNALQELMTTDPFTVIPLDDPKVQEHTAMGMTRQFIEGIDSILTIKE